eukprot:snap_masked-scaffold12_size759060-processed-gene-3.3 protein:Tk05568 transcript:snap_masked-scaffold12_size759060-processed-gene-3.3-mRNA-1 annotation:"transcriptional regulator"
MAALTVILPPNHGHGAHKPIAPKLKGNGHKASDSASPNSEAVTSSTGTKCRRKIAYHPLHGYPIPPPQPAKVARRNARERNRVKQVNCGFEVLRSHIPSAAKQKKMSKVDTLRHAVEYIQTLQTMLGDPDQVTLVHPASIHSSTTTTTLGSSVSDEAKDQCSMAPPALQPAQHRFTPPNYPNPLTPRTPNTPDNFLHVNNYGGGNESGYETSSYYSTGSMLSPVSHVSGPNQALVDYSPNGHSPSTGNLYPADTGVQHYPQAPPAGPVNPNWPEPIPTAYYENSEEDELLDAIAKWQDQE